MALIKPWKSFADLFNTKGTTSDCSFDVIETPALYLDLTTTYLKEVQAMMSLKVSTTSPKFNHEQCQYLVDQLKDTVESARSFLLNQTSTWLESEDMAKSLDTFKLLFASAKQVQSYIRSFCKLDAYSLAAVILPNVFEQFSLLDFDLELSKVAFSSRKECGASQNATSASVDKEALLANVLEVLTQCSKSGDEDWQLVSFLLERLERPIQGSSRELRVFEVDFRSLQQEEKLGSGATCTVHKAIWLGAPVAMKIFTGPEHAHFKKEVAILAGLSHPNVLSLLCSSMDKRWCAIVTELMDEDLFSLIQKRVRLHHDGDHDCAPFSDLESIHLILQVAEGMLYLHGNRIVHRDLKSNNVLVKFVKAREVEFHVKATKMDIGYVHVKVGDFGLSKVKESSNMHSNQTPNVGTNRWMAPEAIKFQDEDDGGYEEVTPKK